MGGSENPCHCSGIRTVLYFRQVCAHACLLTLLQGRCGELRQTGHVSSVGAGWVEGERRRGAICGLVSRTSLQEVCLP